MDLRFALLLSVFVGSGVMQPLLISTLSYCGAYDKSTLLFLLPNYVGMSLAGLLRSDVFRRGSFRPRKLLTLCGIDVVSQLLCQFGLTVAGSSLYIIIYSSATIWIAIESRILIGRRLTPAQWLGCATVVGGLAITGGDVASIAQASDSTVALGAAMILVGSVSHALTWVLVELLLNREEDPVQPEALCAVMGFAGVGTFGGWQLVYTLPRAGPLVLEPIAAHGGNVGTIAASYAALTLASLVHAVAFYHLVGRMGCVTAGVMKGCQAVVVFVCSHVLFCATQPSQCFSTAKWWSLGLVVMGTTIYALSKGHAQQQQQEQQQHEPDPEPGLYQQFKDANKDLR